MFTFLCGVYGFPNAVNVGCFVCCGRCVLRVVFTVCIVTVVLCAYMLYVCVLSVPCLLAVWWCE